MLHILLLHTISNYGQPLKNITYKTIACIGEANIVSSETSRLFNTRPCTLVQANNLIKNKTTLTISTIDRKTFGLNNDDSALIARLVYTNSAFDEAAIELGETFALQLIATGIWITSFNEAGKEKIISKIKAETGGTMSIRRFYKRRKYTFKRSANFKLRFSLFNSEGEDLLNLLPSVNWQKQSYDFVLQLNEEYEKECNAFLILQALHCANCSLGMMHAGDVPALISV